MRQATPDSPCRTPAVPRYSQSALASGVWRRVTLVYIFAGMPLVSGCATHFLRPRAEHRIMHVLEDRIGPAEEYHVRIQRTSDAALVAGHLRSVDIEGRNVWAGGQIELESLHLELRNLRYHPPPEEVVSVGESQLVICLTEKALNDYLRRQNPARAPEISLDRGTVTLKGSLDLLGVPTPLITTGHLEIVDHVRLVFRADSVQLSDDPIPGIGPAYVESHLNPLLNVSHLNLPLRLDDVEVQPGRLIVRGSAYLTAPPRPR